MTAQETEPEPEVVDLTVNGWPRQAHSRIYPTLLQVLCEELGLTGTKYRLNFPSAGAGETPMITIIPAIANAVFAATGVRIRSMPIKGEYLKKS